MRKSEAIAYFDHNVSALARALGIHQSSIYSWKDDTVPGVRQLQLEVLTKSALKAEDKWKPKAQSRKAGA